MKPSRLLTMLSLVVACASATAQDVETTRKRADWFYRALSAYPSRTPGYPGHDEVRRDIAREFRRRGLTQVSEQVFPVTVPVEKRVWIEADGRRLPLHGFWPNDVRLPTTPSEGLSGPLVYGAGASYRELDGHTLQDAIVVCNFASGRNWMNVFEFGGAAVIFVAPDEVSHQQCAEKVLSLPLDAPRFWCDAETGAALIAASQREGATARLQSSMDWRSVETANIIGKLDGSDPELKDEYLIIAAPYDGLSQVPALAPAADSASSLFALLETITAMREQAPARTVIFLATSAHFLGLAGIGAFVRAYDLAASDGELPAQLDADGTRTTAIKAWCGRYFSRYEDDQGGPTAMLVALDLSTHSRQVGVFARGAWEENRDIYRERRYVQVGKRFAAQAAAVCQRMGAQPQEVFADGINPKKGRTVESFFAEVPPFESEVASLLFPAVALATCFDGRRFVGTPADTAERVDLDNLASQTALVSHLLTGLASDAQLPINTREDKRLKAPLFGQSVWWDRTHELFANTPVPSPVVIARIDRGRRGGFLRSYPQPIHGVRMEQMALGDEQGAWSLENFLWPLRARVESFHVRGSDGVIDMAPDLGDEGDRKGRFRHIDVTKKAGRLLTQILFHCSEVGFVNLYDPRNLRSLASLRILDRVTDADPIEFGSALPLATRYETSDIESAAVIFAPADTPISVLMGGGLVGHRFVLLKSSADKPLGTGVVVRGAGRVPLVTRQVTEDLWHIDEYRLNLLAEHGITSQYLARLHDTSRATLDKLDQQLDDRHWSAARQSIDHAWALESIVYPEVLKTSNDVVKGVLFYLFLVVPFAYFVERLLIGMPEIRGQILATVGVFAVVMMVLAAVHPAFAITFTPWIIFLGFLLVALSSLVAMVVAMKFNDELRAYRGQRVGVSEVDVNRIGALTAAVSLGIANMRRRPLRTTLTCSTIVLLTFTVLSFTSIKGFVRFNSYRLPWKAPYQGILRRNLSWAPLESGELVGFRTALGKRFHIAPRAWFISARPEEALRIESEAAVDGREARFGVDCLLGLSPEESHVAPVDEMLTAGRWLRPGESNACLLPDTVARSVGIDADNIERARVQFFGSEFRVVGLFDSKYVDHWEGLSREPISPVNFMILRPQFRSQDEELNPDELALEEFMHWPAGSMAILPYETLMANGGTLRAIAAAPKPGVDIEKVLRELLLQWSLILYAGINDRALLYSSLSSSAVGGVKDLLVPILIAAVIVLNTMLGSVYERVREIGIYSAVGLSPVHIASLFMAEAAVYATMGSILGYLLGQVVAKVLVVTHALAGLTLNYSSGAAVMSICLVMLVVILSSVFPARKASELAVPDLEASWQLGEPEGDEWSFRLPFQVAPEAAVAMGAFLYEFFTMHSEQAVGAFYTTDARFSGQEAGIHTLPCMTFNAWLAPYDFGVSHAVHIEARPVDESTWEWKLDLHRLSGDVNSWRRANRVFLTRIRKQLLLWRTVSIEGREHYGRMGRELLAAEEAEPAAV